MRTKPLNPNSMQVIMENFRKYQTVLKEEFGDHDNKIYLFDFPNDCTYEFKSKKFVESKVRREDLIDNSKLSDMELTGQIIDCVKDVLKAKSLKI